ncbi:MAG TPA: type VI secretion system-associated protein TagF [Steroidobacteraceae bacterium]|nr:type VI secretion system-associated protein TagF [Steroidobacteraceae bacterium]
MAGATVGFFGKLPSHGDFIARRVDDAFRDVWDEWLQRCIAQSRQQLGSHWLDCYLTSPMWRFFLSDGVAGAASYAGVLLPSVDRVGRYFPLSIVVPLPAAAAPVDFACAAARWFAQIEALCAEAVQSDSLTLDALDRQLADSAALLSSVDGLLMPRQSFPGAAHWHWPLADIDAVPAALGAPLAVVAQSMLRPLTMWWTQGSEHVSPNVLLVRGLPQPQKFAALLDGSWEQSGWEGEREAAPAEEALQAATPFAVASGGATDPGTVRAQNQDNFMRSDDSRLWAVADGMGGHSNGDRASQMVVDALNSLEPVATLNAALQSVALALSRVNADLHGAALAVGAGVRSGSTVVALVLRGAQWGISWAGDSRAYLLRAGILTQLTEDHASAATAGEITRAVGGEATLELDTLVDEAADGDRFLLCSDGLHAVLDPAALRAGLADASAQLAAQHLIAAARAAGAADNVTAVVVDVHREAA